MQNGQSRQRRKEGKQRREIDFLEIGYRPRELNLDRSDVALYIYPRLYVCKRGNSRRNEHTARHMNVFINSSEPFYPDYRFLRSTRAVSAIRVLQMQVSLPIRCKNWISIVYSRARQLCPLNEMTFSLMLIEQRNSLTKKLSMPLEIQSFTRYFSLIVSSSKFM